MDKVYMHVVRKISTPSHPDGYEVLLRANTPVWSIPRQGEWIQFEIGYTFHFQVVKTTAFYKQDPQNGKELTVDYIEVMVA